MRPLEGMQRGLFALSGWPVSLALGIVGSVVWLVQTGIGRGGSTLALPVSNESFAGVLGFWIHSGCYSLPMVLTVLFASFSAAALLAGLAVFGPTPFGALLTRLNELGGAVPALLVLMLWRVGSGSATRLGFVVLLSGLFAIEIAELLSETGKRMERAMLDEGEPRVSRWRDLLQHSVHELRAQLATQAALVSSVVFSLDAGLSFVGLGLDGVPTWGAVIGAAAGSGEVAPAGVVLSIFGTLAAVVGAYRLLSWHPWREPTLDLTKPVPPEDDAVDAPPVEPATRD